MNEFFVIIQLPMHIVEFLTICVNDVNIPDSFGIKKIDRP